jgi:hypothetical protein
MFNAVIRLHHMETNQTLYILGEDFSSSHHVYSNCRKGFKNIECLLTSGLLSFDTYYSSSSENYMSKASDLEFRS